MVFFIYHDETSRFSRDEFITGYFLFAAQTFFSVSGKQVVRRCSSMSQVSGELVAVAECKSILPCLVDNKAAGYKVRGGMI